MHKNEHSAIRKLRQKMVVARYSPRTINTYCKCVGELIDFVDASPNRIGKPAMENFIFHKISQGIGDSYQHIFVNAIRTWQLLSYNRKVKLDGLRPRAKKHLPKALSREQIRSGFANITNTKHLAICMLLYTCGFRRDEIVNCQLNWFEKDLQRITITGKGNKQRTVYYSNDCRDVLNKYYQEYKPTIYLFEGATGGRYSVNSVYNLVKQSFQCSPHVLRHSFATHSIESGTDLFTLKELLGHSNLRTVSVYVKITEGRKRKAAMAFG